MTQVRLEYRLPSGAWRVGHRGVELRDPGAYVAKLATRGLQARFAEVEECQWCNAKHPPPFDGGCLI